MADTRTTLLNVRLSYVKFQGEDVTDEGKIRYSSQILLPKTAKAEKAKLDAVIEAATAEAITTKWNGKKPAKVNIAVADGDELRENGEPFGDEAKGCWVFTVKSYQPPQFVDALKNKGADPAIFYSGCYAHIAINAAGYTVKGKSGISLYLNGVMFYKDGEKLSAEASVTDMFGAAPAGEVDLTEGLI